MAYEFKSVEGMAAFFRDLPVELAGKENAITRAALRKVANLIRNDIRRAAPVGEGRLRGRLARNIMVISTRYRDGTPANVLLAITARQGKGGRFARNNAWYFRFVEFATKRNKGQHSSLRFARNAFDTSAPTHAQQFPAFLAAAADKALHRAMAKAARVP